jgi:hypothetical protein
MDNAVIYRLWWVVMALSAVMLAAGVSFPTPH